ncbi:MAG: TIGR02679 domain-containing protein [Lachnospiraceae bacterium]
MKNPKMKECQAYFKERGVYRRVFQKFREKYRSLGHLGGSILLSSVTPEEKMQLEGFFQKNYQGNKTITISAVLLQKSLEDSRFAGLTWEDIWEVYFGEPLVVKKELAQQAKEQKEHYFRMAEEAVQGTSAAAWLHKVLHTQGDGYQILMQQYGANPEVLKETLFMVLKAIQNLPVLKRETKRLAVFAAAMTQDPHYFDEGSVGERLLSAYIRDAFGDHREAYLSKPEQKNSLLFQAGIVKDDISNYTLVYGIHGINKSGILHEGIEGFFHVKEPLQLSLRSLSELQEAEGNPVVYVLENPSVFSVLTEECKEITAVCTNGQPRLASLVLLDFLSKKSMLLYAGDFDPEGLLIAQNLKKRYGEKLQFWNYKATYYEKTISSIRLSPTRMKKLEKVEEAGLLEVKEAIKKEGKAAYQEELIEMVYLPGIYNCNDDK